MRNLSVLGDALGLIDEVNQQDPRAYAGQPLAYHQGIRASYWISELEPNPSAELQVAARAHHLRRWEIERATFPVGRAGYLKWRLKNKAHQALEVQPLMETAGFDESSRSRVAVLLSRKHLATDVETQHLEDAACLVFLETEYDALAARTEPERLQTIVGKTKAKMSAAAWSRVDL